MFTKSFSRLLLGTAVLLLVAIAGPAQAQTKTVKVTAIVEHPALNAVRDGTRDELAERGYVVGENLNWEFQTAQGDVGIASQIARKYVGDNPDVIVAIATPSAQAAVSAANGRIPVVFSAVTDPVAAKLVDSLDHPGGNVTGVSDMAPIDRHLEFIRNLMPQADTLGVPYNPGEANAVVQIKALKKLAPKHGFTVETAAAPKSSRVLIASRSLIGKVDAIYVPTDNTIVSALEAVVKVGRSANIPVFSADTNSVSRGAAAAIGFSYYDIGRQTGALVARILEDEKAGSIPVQFVHELQIYLNPSSAKKMGLTFPDTLTERAYEIIE